MVDGGGRWVSVTAGNQSDEKQKRQSDSNDAIGTKRPIGGRPREHQDIEEWHNFIWPEQSGHPKCQTQLENKAQPQINHDYDFNTRTPFY